MVRDVLHRNVQGVVDFFSTIIVKCFFLLFSMEGELSSQLPHLLPFLGVKYLLRNTDLPEFPPPHPIHLLIKSFCAAFALLLYYNASIPFYRHFAPESAASF